METQFALTLPVSYCTLESRHEYCPRQDFYSLIRLYTVYMVGLLLAVESQFKPSVNHLP